MKSDTPRIFKLFFYWLEFSVLYAVLFSVTFLLPSLEATCIEHSFLSCHGQMLWKVLTPGSARLNSPAAAIPNIFPASSISRTWAFSLFCLRMLQGPGELRACVPRAPSTKRKPLSLPKVRDSAPSLSQGIL